MPEDVYFVRLRNSIDVRKRLLRCSKEVIQEMQRYQTISDLRKVKHRLVTDLKRNLQEIVVLTDKLVTLLPAKNLRAIPTKKEVKEELEAQAKKVGSKPPKKTVKKAVKKKATKVDQLQSSLAMIESKLKSIE